MAQMTIEEMRAAVAKADAEEMAKRSQEMAEKMDRIRAFNGDPVVSELKDKLLALEGIDGTESHIMAIRTGLQGLSTLA